MTIARPDRAAHVAGHMINPKLSTSESWETLEEKKSGDAGDYVGFESDLAMEKKIMMKSSWRNVISNAPDSKFQPEKGRYTLYISCACPSSHVALMALLLKGLEDTVSVVYVRSHKDDNIQRNWMISHEIPDDSMASFKSDEGDFTCIRDIYAKEHDNNTCNSIPLLYDKFHERIVNNNSNDIVFMLSTSFDSFCKHPSVGLLGSNDAMTNAELQDWLYPLLQLTPSNQPPYHYDLSPHELEVAFAKATSILQKQRYLTSHSSITVADLRLFAALVRYEEVYSKFLEQPSELLHNRVLMDYCRDIYQEPNVASTVRFHEIREHFLGSSSNGVVSKGSSIADFLPMSHQRELL